MSVRFFLRSKLFVPGTRPELFQKALNSDADALSLDLEDSVHATLKSSARQNIVEFLNKPADWETNKLIIVRVNDLSQPEAEEDINAIVSSRLDIINIPKVESAADIRKAVGIMERAETRLSIKKPIAILANIETPKGLRFSAEIACADARVMGLQIGFADLFGVLGVDHNDQQAAHQVRLLVRLAAGEAGIEVYDAAFLDIQDKEALRATAQVAKRLGFSGKSCIHPSQIAIINEVFMPSDVEIKQAKELLEYSRQNNQSKKGVFVFNGQMIDKPVIEAAERIVQLSTFNR